jgi:hypothetical protein
MVRRRDSMQLHEFQEGVYLLNYGKKTQNEERKTRNRHISRKNVDSNPPASVSVKYSVQAIH